MLQNQESVSLEPVIFHQLYEPVTSTYTYLLADPQSREAVLIDPVLETVDRDAKLLEELGLKLKYILDTHVHADHITGAGELKARTGAKTVISGAAGVKCVDLAMADGDELSFGPHTIRALATPGHTDSCMSYVIGDRVFTGDALLIRGTGRTDFQQGSAETLFDSITQKLYRLPDSTRVYPGHDYRGFTASTIGEEKAYNARINLRQSKKDFVRTMSELNMGHPKKIHEAVPANMLCGKITDKRVFHPQVVDGMPEITVQDLHKHFKEVQVVDVRFITEYAEGHIPGAQLVTLGPDLENFLREAPKDKEMVFVCRSGGRSAQATQISRRFGFEKVVNLQGGMIKWREMGYEEER